MGEFVAANLRVKMTRRKGRGVFANCRIKRGEIIEIAPVIVLSQREARILRESTTIYNYCYNWGPRGSQTALALGHGSLINHSYDPNTEYYLRLKRRSIVFKAIRDIANGEEITHNYNGSPDDQCSIRFTKNSWERM